jgi:hypothetical protein
VRHRAVIDRVVLAALAINRRQTSSSYRSVCKAMEDASTWLSCNSTESDLAVILTDSLSLVSKLQSGQVKKVWLPVLDTISARTEIMYIPGHAGIRFNERADKLARAAEAFGDLELTDGDIIRVLTEAIIGKKEEEESTFSMTRLGERGIVRGEGAQVTLRGDIRRISTQLLTGAMSMAGLKSLLEMLEGRGPVYIPEPLLF